MPDALRPDIHSDPPGNQGAVQHHQSRVARMPDPNQLPHLIKLLDDESPTVRNTVLNELAAFGGALEHELLRLKIMLGPHQMRTLQSLLREHNSKWLKEAWPMWFGMENDNEKLEKALSLIAEYQNGRLYHVELKDLLDDLAHEFTSSQRPTNARELSNFLFRTKPLQGAHSDYYNPCNSNLVYVIERKRGIPISLVCIYILVGYRLGLAIAGCNFPGHFLALISENKKQMIVDCFDGGRFLEDADLAHLNAPLPLTTRDLAQLRCGAVIIVARVLRNLINAYQFMIQQVQKDAEQEHYETKLKLIRDLLGLLEADAPRRQGR